MGSVIDLFHILLFDCVHFQKVVSDEDFEYHKTQALQVNYLFIN